MAETRFLPGDIELENELFLYNESFSDIHAFEYNELNLDDADLRNLLDRHLGDADASSVISEEPGDSDGVPEKILAERNLVDSPNHDSLDLAALVPGRHFLVKWKDCPDVKALWVEAIENADPFKGSVFEEILTERAYLQLGHPIREAWEEEKKRIERGESVQFVTKKWLEQREEVERLRAHRRQLRRFKKHLETIAAIRKPEPDSDSNEDEVPPQPKTCDSQGQSARSASA